MGYVIVTRNPRNNQVIAITEGESEFDEHLAEFKTEAEADEAANDTAACKAWGYQIIEVD